MKNISTRQQSILSYLRRFLSENGYPPAIRDIVNGCNISSTSVVDYNLNLLEKRGYIRRHRDISRGIELLGDNYSPHATQLIPIIGQIAAGKPIPVLSSDSFSTQALDTIAVSENLTGGRENLFALNVKGTSMIEELINDGDTILLEAVSTVENGETAAVWLEEEKEATLKKVYVEKKRIRLQPANSRMKPIYTRPENVSIQGRVIAVLRKFT